MFITNDSLKEYGWHSYLKGFCYYYATNCWFLIGIFFCSLLVIIIKFFFKDSLIIYFASFIFSFFIPDRLNSNLYVFIYFYFLMGYLLNKYIYSNYLADKKNKQFFNYKKGFIAHLTGWLFIALWAVMLLFYSKNSYIYITGTFVFARNRTENIFLIDCYRYLIGMIGSASFLFCIYFLRKRIKIFPLFSQIVERLGQDTLGLYILNNFLNRILQIITFKLQYNLCIVFLETILELVVMELIISLCKKYSLTRKILLGLRN